MWPNPQFPADLVTFTEENLHRKLHFMRSDIAAAFSKFYSSQYKLIDNLLSFPFNHYTFLSTAYSIYALSLSLITVLEDFLILFINLWLTCGKRETFWLAVIKLQNELDLSCLYAGYQFVLRSSGFINCFSVLNLLCKKSLFLFLKESKWIRAHINQIFVSRSSLKTCSKEDVSMLRFLSNDTCCFLRISIKLL